MDGNNDNYIMDTIWYNGDLNARNGTVIQLSLVSFFTSQKAGPIAPKQYGIDM